MVNNTYSVAISKGPSLYCRGLTPTLIFKKDNKN